MGVEVCERFAYVGISGPLQDYLQTAADDPLRPGAIGLGQNLSTAMNHAFTLWCYLAAIAGAIVADQYLGRLRTIRCASLVYVAGLAVLLLSSLLPTSAAALCLCLALLLIGLGAGGIKPNVSALVAEQCVHPEPVLCRLPSGEAVIVDPALTVERIFNTFYACVNVGSLSSVATTWIELRLGFWAAFLVPLVIFCLGSTAALASSKRLVIRPPRASVVASTARVLLIALTNNGDLDAAKPSRLCIAATAPTPPWDDGFVDELRQTLHGCAPFLLFPLYWVAYSQMLTSLVSQAASMQTHGVPNDMLVNIDPITVIIFTPLLDRIIYPFLRRRLGVRLRPASRIATAFGLCGAAIAYSATLQHVIYAALPCFDHPRSPACHSRPNTVHIAMWIPAYLLIAFSEILASTTGMQLAFMRAPATIRSVVIALYLCTITTRSVLAIALSPMARDPLMTVMYAFLSAECFGVGLLFWWLFRDRTDGDDYNYIEGEGNSNDSTSHAEYEQLEQNR